MGTIRNILVEVPNVDTAPHCLELVQQLALSEVARITLMSILTSFADLFSLFDSDDVREDLQEGLDRQAESAMSALAGEVQKTGLRCDTVLTKGSRRARKLIAQVIEEEHDLLVRDASPEHGDSRSAFGDVDHQLVRHCPCPVWLLREERHQASSGQVLIAVDAILEDPIHRDLNKRLIRYGRALARSFGAELHILHVWDFDSTGCLRGSVEQSKYVRFRSSAKQAAEEKMRKFSSEMSLSANEATIHILEGTPGKEIARYCDEHDISSLVIGSVGRAGLSGYLIGNTAERVMRTIECSVLVVNPTQVQSPIEMKLREEMSEIGEPALAGG
jgi:nucleotide-binding universal stress UspA family protein